MKPEEIIMLRSPLLQVRDWLYREELQTFFKFVRIFYSLKGETNITIIEAKRLHGQIVVALAKQAKYMKKSI